MERKIFIILISLFLGGNVYAQEKKWSEMTPEEKSEKVTNRMKTEYDLTEEQTKKIKQLNTERFSKIAEAKKKYTLDQKKEYQQERRTINKQFNERLKSVLTPEQYQKHLNKMEERKKNANNKKQGNKLPPHPALKDMEEEITD